ncbi:hypothetical protein AALP_AA3G152200 [Arabis alpina]|uniref:Ubiquitin-like protease family profile domain-containing protein n=1 Tax=Arabis alpina TaxID=50452 RepID=A0A087H9C3_ARAAL|nr:hypothetical protein AALP_AA3G152200 [Arabis alpina]
MMEGRERVESDASGSSLPNSSDDRLPCRLFATDRYPNARLNVYSKPDLVTFVRDALVGTEEFVKIRESPLGVLFDLPVSRCPISCKLLHALLTRQLLTTKKYELWTVFGGQPLRFSLSEFREITGLPCGEFPGGYNPNVYPVVNEKKDPMWLVCGDKLTTLADLANEMRKSKDMPGWRKLAISLLLIVDGVLIGKLQCNRPTPKYVRMLADVDAFLRFPWGREAFVKTLSTMRPLLQPTSKVADPIGTYCQQLQQHTFRLQGFPLALQLLAYRCIPLLLNKVPNSDDGRSFLESSFLGLPKLTSLSRNDILEVENAAELTVEPLLPLFSSGSAIDGWGEWDDEDRDRKVIYMQDLIRNGHVFKKDDWPGGFAGLEEVDFDERTEVEEHVNHVFDRKGKAVVVEKEKEKCARTVKGKQKAVVKKKGGSKGRQRHLDSYFQPATRSGAQLKDWFESKLEEVRSSLSEKIVEQAAEIAKLKKRRSVACWSGFGKMSRGAKVSSKRRRRAETINLESPPAKKGKFTRDGETLSEAEVTVDSPLANNSQGSPDEPLEPMDGGRSCTPEEGFLEDVLSEDVVVNEKSDQPIGCADRCKEDAGVEEEGNAGIDVETRAEENVCRALDMTVEVDGASEGECLEENCDVENTGEENDVNLGDDEEEYDPELCSITPGGNRQRTDPVEIELILVKKFSLKKKRDGTDLLPPLDRAEFAFFAATLKACPHIECVTSEGLSLNSQFLLDLAQPSGLVSITHMEVLVAFLSGRHAATLLAEKCLFASLWFVSYLQGKYSSFEKALNKKRVKWSDRMIKLVTEEGSTWFEDIDTVYVPMCWESVHWVGVAIHLKIWSVEVYDPAPSLYTESQMLELMGPVTKMLPHIVGKYCPGGESQNNGVNPFGCRRVEGIYESTHSDNSGPVAVKFLELELCGNPGEGMGFIRDDVVDDFRKQYAMDIFQEWFVPFYPNMEDAV